MKKSIFLGLFLTLLICVNQSFADFGEAPFGDNNISTTISRVQGLIGRINDGVWQGLKVLSTRAGIYTSSMSTASDPSVTSRIEYYLPKGAQVLVLVLGNLNSTSSGTECTNIANSIEIHAAIEYPIDLIHPVTFNGATSITIPACKQVVSDPIAINVPVGGTIYTRQFFKNNGSQTYPLNIQSVNDFSNSGKNGDGAGQLITNATNASPIVITTNGNHNMSTGDTAVIDSVSGNTAANGTWTITKLSATTFSLDTSTGSGAYTSGGRLRGNDLTLAGSGVMYGNQGPLYYAPIAVIGIPAVSSITIGGIGDSIMQASSDISTLDISLKGSIGLVANDLQVPWMNLGVGGTTISEYTDTSTSPALKDNLRMIARLPDYRFNNFGTNDISYYPVATIQANLISSWLEQWRQGKREIALTMVPKTSSTDSWATTTNQTPANALTVNAATNASPIAITTSAAHYLTTGQTVQIRSCGGNTAANGTWTITVTGSTTFTLNGSTGNGVYTSGGKADAPEANRQFINTWLRDGAPINSSYVAVAAGTSGAIRAGDVLHPLWAVVDWAQPVEVNSSNVATLNGGYWIVTGASNYATSDGTHPLKAAYDLMKPKVSALSMPSY